MKFVYLLKSRMFQLKPKKIKIKKSSDSICTEYGSDGDSNLK